MRRTLTTSRQWTAQWAEEEPRRPKRPAWLSEEELAVYVEAFERTGFTGGLNWYRNIDRNWELTEPYAERRVEQPAMFLTGELDMVRAFMPAEAMDGWVTDLRVDDRRARAPGTGSSSRSPRPSTRRCSSSSAGSERRRRTTQARPPPRPACAAGAEPAAGRSAC